MKSNVSHMLEKAGICGVATGVLGGYFFGFDAYWNLALMNTRIPLLMLTIPLGVANSFIADGLHSIIHKHIPLGKKTADQTAFITNGVISGASLVALMGIVDSNVLGAFSMPNAFLVGAIGEIVGTGTYEYLVNNLYI